jgi:hypothetical protein
MPKLLCLCCDRELVPVFDDKPCYQPEHGLICSARGNYGSTKFDPMLPEDRGYLLFFVCDDCITMKKAGVYFVRQPADDVPVPAGPFIR